jgi:hypothetical protein
METISENVEFFTGTPAGKEGRCKSSQGKYVPEIMSAGIGRSPLKKNFQKKSKVTKAKIKRGRR